MTMETPINFGPETYTVSPENNGSFMTNAPINVMPEGGGGDHGIGWGL